MFSLPARKTATRSHVDLAVMNNPVCLQISKVSGINFCGLARIGQPDTQENTGLPVGSLDLFLVLAEKLLDGWERSETSDGIPYYLK